MALETFKTITEAIRSIKLGSAKRVIVSTGGGVYNEKIEVDRTKPFVTLYGTPNNMPKLAFAGDAKRYGTVDSATLIVESDYSVAANIIVANTLPRPDGKRLGAQAVALSISGDKAAFYNCQFLGFQGTLKYCNIEGTVDYIFGSGTSLYLNTELHVLGDKGLTVITAQARESTAGDTGYSFVHCSITGTGKATCLGRAWENAPRTIFAYTMMSNVVAPTGWFNNYHPQRERFNGGCTTVEFGEYKNIQVQEQIQQVGSSLRSN